MWGHIVYQSQGEWNSYTLDALVEMPRHPYATSALRFQYAPSISISLSRPWGPAYGIHDPCMQVGGGSALGLQLEAEGGLDGGTLRSADKLVSDHDYSRTHTVHKGQSQAENSRCVVTVSVISLPSSAIKTGSSTRGRPSFSAEF